MNKILNNHKKLPIYLLLLPLLVGMMLWPLSVCLFVCFKRYSSKS